MEITCEGLISCQEKNLVSIFPARLKLSVQLQKPGNDLCLGTQGANI